MNEFTPLAGFRSEKAAQIASYFLSAHGGHMEKLALIKLIYIAERDSVKIRNRPMIYDELYSLKDGPMCKSATDGINGEIDEQIWSKYIAVQGDRDIYADRDKKGDVSQLSRFDLKILDGVLTKHKNWSSIQLRNWLHVPANCPEYTEVFGNARVPIEYSDLAEAVGAPRAGEVQRLVKDHREQEIAISRI